MSKLKPGSIIKVGESLSTDEYIQSPNRLFMAYMQGDGNFCVSRGSGPEDFHGTFWCSADKPEPEGQYYAAMQDDGNFCVSEKASGRVLWCCGVSLPKGSYFACLQDDGNFVVNKGTDMDQPCEYVWGTQAIDPPVNFVPSDIKYHMEKWEKLGPESPTELYSQFVRNDMDLEQTSEINARQGVTESSSWQTGVGITIGVATEFSVGVPLFAEGKVQVSLEMSATFSWSGSESRTKEWGFNAPITVPPHSVGEVLVGVLLSTISVPYTVSGTVELQSGAKYPATFEGIYVGRNSHDLEVTYRTVDLESRQIREPRTLPVVVQP